MCGITVCTPRHLCRASRDACPLVDASAVVEVVVILSQGLIGDLWFDGEYYIDDVGLVLELLSGDISLIECRAG